MTKELYSQNAARMGEVRISYPSGTVRVLNPAIAPIDRLTSFYSGNQDGQEGEHDVLTNAFAQTRAGVVAIMEENGTILGAATMNIRKPILPTPGLSTEAQVTVFELADNRVDSSRQRQGIGSALFEARLKALPNLIGSLLDAPIELGDGDVVKTLDGQKVPVTKEMILKALLNGEATIRVETTLPEWGKAIDALLAKNEDPSLPIMITRTETSETICNAGRDQQDCSLMCTGDYEEAPVLVSRTYVPDNQGHRVDTVTQVCLNPEDAVKVKNWLKGTYPELLSEVSDETDVQLTINTQNGALDLSKLLNDLTINVQDLSEDLDTANPYLDGEQVPASGNAVAVTEKRTMHLLGVQIRDEQLKESIRKTLAKE